MYESALRCDANYPKTLQKKRKTSENTSNYSEKMQFRKVRSSQDICLNVYSLSSKVQVYMYIYVHIYIWRFSKMMVSLNHPFWLAFPL